jgi:hypothetical protein
MQGVSKVALQLGKRIYIYIEGVHNILKCKQVGKHIRFYVGQLWFDMTSICDAADVPPVFSFFPHATSHLWRHFCICGGISNSEFCDICR